MTVRKKPKRKSNKVGGSAKITLTALSLMGFIGGWNLFARLENKEVQASQVPATPLPTPVLSMALPPPTPWPAIPALAKISPVPTLAPFAQVGAVEPATNLNSLPAVTIAPVNIAPLPTLAPLPPMPEAPPPPPTSCAGWWLDAERWIVVCAMRLHFLKKLITENRRKYLWQRNQKLQHHQI